ncbi:hypothetical protein [Streptomyces xanthophaeus]
MYSWGTIEDARIYADVRLGQGVNVEIVPFRVSAEDFLGLKKAEIVSMSPEDAERFMDAHSRIYGEGLPHDYDYIRGFTGKYGREHFFDKSIFHLLKF